MKEYLMALDQGTTGSRCIIFRRDGTVAASAAKELTQYFPKEGWVEHDAKEIFDSEVKVAKLALSKAGLTAADIAAIGITNQRETTVVFEKESGAPVCPAIVWQCRRTAADCEALRRAGYTPLIREKTGLPIDPYFSATKLSYILDHVPDARRRAERGELLFGTVDSYLIYRLTGGRVHATDPTNASRTLLFDIHKLAFDEELLKLFRIPASMLPEVRPSAGFFGETDPALFGAPIPITGVAGDQQAALFGQGCFAPGDLKNTYGTGAFLLMNTGEKAICSESGLLTTVAFQTKNEVNYALEGSVFVCGAAIQWLRDGLGILQNAAESETLAASVPDSGGVYFLPAFVGLGTPYWNPDVRGTIFGIGRGTRRAHLVRATLEAMALQTADVMDIMQKETGLTPGVLRVDGGAAANRLLLSLQSDFSGVTVRRPACVETTAFGAAALAGLSAGVYRDKAEIAALLHADAEFYPSLSPAGRKEKLSQWHKALNAAISFS